MLETALVPAKTESSQLMIVLHGLGDSLEGYQFLPAYLNLPWLNYLLVNAPDPYYGGFSWYDIYENPGAGIQRSRGLLIKLIDSQIAKGFPASQISLLGFSQGCLMTFEMGLRYPARFAGLVGISGYLHEPETALQELSKEAREQRFLITHGTRDPLIPIEKVRPQIQLLTQAGLSIEWREFDKEHTIAGSAEIAVIRSFVEKCYKGDKFLP